MMAVMLFTFLGALSRSSLEMHLHMYVHGHLLGPNKVDAIIEILLLASQYCSTRVI